MKTEIRMIGTGLLAAGLLAGTALAEAPVKERARREKPEMSRDKDGDAGSAERREFQQKQQELMKAHWDAQREAGKKNMQAVMQEEDAYKALAMYRAFRVDQQAKTAAFHDKQWERQMTFTKSMLEKKGVAPEKREEIIKNMTSGHEERKAAASARFEGMLKKLDALAAKEGLTKNDLRAAVREAFGREGQGGREHPGMGRKPRQESGDATKIEEKRRERKEGGEAPVRKEQKKRERKEGEKQVIKTAPDA